MDDLLFLDSNNNNNDDDDGAAPAATAAPSKYSLRPRALQRRRPPHEDAAAAARPASLRRGRCKQKPPPLSKYRRKTANARERDRMREINAAFETLRRAVPPHEDLLSQQQDQEKLTKITTLRLAMRYIAALTEALEAAEVLPLPPPAVVDHLLASDGESLETFHSADLTPPHSADFDVSDFGDSLTPPPDYFVTSHGAGLQHFCLTPPPGFEDQCCLLAP